MPNVVGNIIAGTPLATGGVLIGALGSTLPTDSTTAPEVAFVSAGYVGEDGLTESGSRSTDKKKEWGGRIVRVLQTDYSLTFQFSFLESRQSTVLSTVFGDDNVTTTAADGTHGNLHAIKRTADILPHKAFIFEMKDGDTKTRIVVPDGQITEVGDITWTNGDLVQYQVTVEAFPDASGANAYEYTDDGAIVAS
jgi:hypothetical protein